MALKNRLTSLLRRSERYTKTDMVYISANGARLLISNIVSAALAFCTSIAFANLLPKTVYGSYQYVLSIVALVSILALPGMKTAVSYASARGSDRSLFTIAALKLRFGALAGAGALAFSLYYFVNGNGVLGGGFLVTALFLPFWEAPGLYVAYLQGKKRFDLMNRYENTIQAVSTIGIVACLLFTDNLSLLLLAYFGVLVLARLFFFIRALRDEPPKGPADPAAITYGKHLTVMAAFGAVAANADKFLLWHLAGPAALAGYVFALAIPQRAVGVVRIAEQLAFPKMAQQPLTHMRAALLRKIFFSALIASAMTIVYIALAPFIFRVFFSPYLEVLPLTELAAGLIALQPFALIATAFSAHAQTRELYVLSIASPLLQVGLLLALVPAWGALGGIVTLLVVQAAESVLLVGLLFRNQPRAAA